MTPPPPPPLVVFDFDGTLADTRQAVAATVNAVLAAHGHPRVAPEAIVRRMGLPLATLFRKSLLPWRRNDDLAPLVAAYRARFPALGEPLVTPYDEVGEVLDALADRGLRLAIATSRARASVDRLLGPLGLQGRFEAVVTCDDVTEGKPHPETLAVVAARTGVAPEQQLMVGDTTFDVAMARAAGAPVVAVAQGCHDADTLASAGPLAVLPDLRGLIGWLDR